MKNLNEKCAVFGIYDSSDAARKAYFGLFALQHRGQEQTGIVSSDGTQLYVHKGTGLVSQVYTEKDIETLLGHIAIGHNRYATSRGGAGDCSQPVEVDGKFSFAHNGNLPSTKLLEEFLKNKNVTTEGLSDSEMMAQAIGVYVKEGIEISLAITKAYGG